MNFKNHNSIITTFVLSIFMYLVHKSVVYFFLDNEIVNQFVYSLELLYLFFGFSSITIVFLLLKINQKSVNNVGYTFLLVTTVKMALAYFFLQPILKSKTDFIKIEKMNFFIVFIVFLAIETIITIKMLNKKQ